MKKGIMLLITLSIVLSQIGCMTKSNAQEVALAPVSTEVVVVDNQVTKYCTLTFNHYLQLADGSMSSSPSATTSIYVPVNSFIYLPDYNYGYAPDSYYRTYGCLEGTGTVVGGFYTTGDATYDLYYGRTTYHITTVTGTGVEYIDGSNTTWWGNTITTVAYINAGYTFNKWTSNNPTCLFGSTNQSYTFTVPKADVVLTASATANSNYAQEMINAAITGNTVIGLQAEQNRNDKIDRLQLCVPKISFNDLFLLSKIMTAEAGSSWLSDEWKMAVGEVLLNRVASPEFPNTIADCIYQSGQYYSESSSFFKKLIPHEREVYLAWRLLNGERHLVPSVVFQANFTQGFGTFITYKDKYLGKTYLCFSSRPELYGE